MCRGDDDSQIAKGHRQLARLIAGDLPIGTELQHADGVTLRRLALEGNYWEVVIDGTIVTCFDGDQAPSTIVLKQQIDKLCSLHRETDDHNSVAYH